jgi:hypothetical protein
VGCCGDVCGDDCSRYGGIVMPCRPQQPRCRWDGVAHATPASPLPSLWDTSTLLSRAQCPTLPVDLATASDTPSLPWCCDVSSTVIQLDSWWNSVKGLTELCS